MSQMTSAARTGARPLNRPTTTTTSTRLRVVTGAPPHHGGAAFGIICATLLAAGLIGLLLLNTALAQGSFTLHDLRVTSAQLTDTQDALTQSLQRSESPANLAASAARMGMVPAQSAAFLRLSDGKVIGVAKPAKAPPGFAVIPSQTPAPASAQAHAKPVKPASNEPLKPASNAPPKPGPR